jgi:hypothetical protein
MNKFLSILDKIPKSKSERMRAKVEEIANELGIEINEQCHIYECVYEILKQVSDEFVRTKEKR